MAGRLQKLGIHTVQNLLFHLPSRYQDRSHIRPIGSLLAGQESLVEGEIQSAHIAMGRRRSLVCKLYDGSGVVTLRFFHFNAQQQRHLGQGSRLRCYGELRFGAGGPELYHPDYQRVDAGTALPTTLTPVYPATEGIGQAAWRRLMVQALGMAQSCPPRELLPADAQRQRGQLIEALTLLHAPPLGSDQGQLARGCHPAQQRLALEELLAHHLGLLRLRQQFRRQAAPQIPPETALSQQLLTSLPFALTSAQRRVIAEISTDLSQHHPMLRLLQGDVGSGKTLVAALAALQAVAAGHQVAIMAPTEILAEQHLHNFEQWFGPMGFQVACLIGRLKGRARAMQLAAIGEGEAAIAIGTHALFQEDVFFHRLGLIIVDEQHRFGVHQRLLLRDKGHHETACPHQLIMTATPIPRTLAMTAYADLDCSTIDELPPGRAPVVTAVVANTRRDEVMSRVRNACEQGHQVYWVCTLIEESDALQAQAAQSTATELTDTLPGIAVGLIHGRQKAQEKAAAMAAFKGGEVKVLVATTVIEVGVDVPNASLMVIENPERLGLAQLHQLRGRVGRGSKQSHCVLLYQAPLSKAGKARLQAMRDSNDGFYIARKDLELRGPGEILGTRQTGMLEFRVADLQRDQSLIEEVKQLAGQILEHQPQLIEPLLERWLPQGQCFGGV